MLELSTRLAARRRAKPLQRSIRVDRGKRLLGLGVPQQRIDDELGAFCDVGALDLLGAGKHLGDFRVVLLGRLLSLCQDSEENRAQCP